jgi:drug/metabolite transporter (DMT)-like permease
LTAGYDVALGAEQGRSAPKVQGHAICVAAIVLFATGFPAAGVLLDRWGPISLIALRAVLACALLLPIWLYRDGLRRVLGVPWLRGLWIGAMGFGTGTVALLVTQSMTDTVTAALMAAMMPLAAVTLEVLFDGRRMTVNFATGVMLVLTGGVVATGTDLAQSQFGIGAALGIVSTFIFAWGSRKTVKGLPTVSNFGQTTLTMLGAMLFCVTTLGVFLVFGWAGAHWAPLSGNDWVLVLIYAWGAMAVSQALWILGVSRMGIGVASFHLNATPFYVMLIVVALGGSWSWAQAIGAAILAVGVILAQRGESWAEAAAA